MKKHFIFLLAIVLLAGACSTGSNKRVTQGIDYSQGNVIPETYYEFTSPFSPEPDPLIDPLMDPTVTEETKPAAEEMLGEDEDFTSENLTSSYQNYGDVVATVATRKFKLGAQASRKEMSFLMKAVEAAYTNVLRTYRPKGFTYSVSSVGAVNPLSDVEIHCKMSETSANKVGQSACTQFFATVRTRYIELLQEAK